MKKRDKGFCLDPLYQACPYPKLLWMSKGWLLMVPRSPLLQKLPSSTRELPPPPQEAALRHDWLTQGHRDWPLASAGPLYTIHTSEPHHPLAPPGIRLKLNSSGDHSLTQLRPSSPIPLPPLLSPGEHALNKPNALQFPLGLCLWKAPLRVSVLLPPPSQCCHLLSSHYIADTNSHWHQYFVRFSDCFLYARHYAKCFTCIILCNPYNHLCGGYYHLIG